MRRSLIAFLLLGSCLAAPVALAASPPKQPAEGPGGTDYKVAEVTKRAVGTASAAAYIFHAAGAAAEPRPVVVFLHSWGATNPGLYGGWIEHLARKGHLVIVPRFQEVNRTKPADATSMAATILRNALTTLANDPAAHPDLDRVAYIGHLAGVPIALNLATGGGQEGLPTPKLILGLMPGGIATGDKSRGIPLDDLSAINGSTLLITMSGDRDYLPADRTAKRILTETTQIPASRKLFMRVGSDDHGYPALTATLVSPGSPKAEYDASTMKLPPEPPKDPKQRSTWRWSADMALTGEQTVLTAQLGNNAIDTLDYLAFWKTFDMAADAAFSGKDAAFLRRDPKFIDMGTWSDGWPVRRLSADMPKGAGDEKQERGPRRLLNLGPAGTKESLREFLNQRS
ncbi:chlorophyllase/cutinase-like alpha/beta fold protein [Microvirga terricola]|uniref:Alpha/beta hydrolase n=1 Tax=Microvirga terricola TaxID=2719797 RepID=A0ABX0VBW1_9HYPH|nr:alpha/beta hydrolase [Microvirga terricola]NIX76551.1 alpha/beta hydrolase [Microvirga terricola]